MSLESVFESDLALYTDEQIGLFDAPFDYLEAGAKIAIVGVTPGPAQAFAVIRCALEGMRAGHDDHRVQKAVKHAASFKGMRGDLAAWFDAVGLAERLALSTSSELFSSRGQDALHTTSAVRYPTFERCNGGWRNWNGYGVSALGHRVLKAMIRRVLGPELRALRHAVIVPLGKANDAVEYLCKSGELDASRCVLGFPHPSPASARRHELFAARRRKLEQQVETLHQRDGEPGLSARHANVGVAGHHERARADRPHIAAARPPRPPAPTSTAEDPLRHLRRQRPAQTAYRRLTPAAQSGSSSASRPSPS